MTSTEPTVATSTASSPVSSTPVSSSDLIRPALSPIQPPDRLLNEICDQWDEEDDDIYRGDPPPLPRSPSPAPSSSSSSSSSSSASFLGGGRIGAIAAVVELAITRWARGNGPASDTSSLSSSTRSSIVTVTRSQVARRRRRRSSISSVASFQNLASERDIAARITRLKALEESRQIPREFSLYFPPSLIGGRKHPSIAVSHGPHSAAQSPRITRTASLPTMLNELDLVLKKSMRHRRMHTKHRPVRAHLKAVDQVDLQPHLHYMIPGEVAGLGSSSHIHPTQGAQKGKHKEKVTPDAKNHVSVKNSILQTPIAPKAWFLDVSSPTWEDLRAIGKLLHLHPLTLEDILQQDPREKLELFPKLGYYFISFRAIESQSTREKVLKKRDGDLSTFQDEGPVGEANVYLTVFKEGICCFHFTDISEHTDRVRNRIVLLEEVINMSSDWIAHGILDSIVDSFFPFLDEIEKEVMAIDELAYSVSAEISKKAAPFNVLESAATRDTSAPSEKGLDDMLQPLSEKITPRKVESNIRPRFAQPRLTVALLSRRLRRFFSSRWHSRWKRQEPFPSSTTIVLRRMARTRRLVTSLGRLLATKSEVVAQIRKRLNDFNRIGLGNGSTKGEDPEVAIYMGDIHDHILTLQHSLAHYERMLSQSHPTYISQLRSTFMGAKSRMDGALIYLTVVSISVLCIQTLIGIFSMNVTLPSNLREPGGRFDVFGVVITLAVIVICTFLSVVRYWWNQAKRKRGSVL